jgi:hypothetical protein
MLGGTVKSFQLIDFAFAQLYLNGYRPTRLETASGSPTLSPATFTQMDSSVAVI